MSRKIRSDPPEGATSAETKYRFEVHRYSSRWYYEVLLLPRNGSALWESTGVRRKGPKLDKAVAEAKIRLIERMLAKKSDDIANIEADCAALHNMRAAVLEALQGDE